MNYHNRVSSCNETKLTVFTIATNKYWDYFKALLPNLRFFIDDEWELDIIVLTNREPEGRFTTQLKNTSITVRKSEFDDWPDVTLMRYKQILTHQNLIGGDRFLWIDVDMKFQKKFDPSILNSGVWLAPHPGYSFSFQGFKNLRLGQKKDYVVEMIKLLSRNQFSRGAWEDNPCSSAYVPNIMRKVYVHGAFWGGNSHEIIKMCHILHTRIEKDLDISYVAIWHDESHLNWFHANHPQKLLPRHFSGVANCWTSNVIQSTILSLDKTLLDIEIEKQ